MTPEGAFRAAVLDAAHGRRCGKADLEEEESAVVPSKHSACRAPVSQSVSVLLKTGAPGLHSAESSPSHLSESCRQTSGTVCFYESRKERRGIRRWNCECPREGMEKHKGKQEEDFFFLFEFCVNNVRQLLTSSLTPCHLLTMHLYEVAVKMTALQEHLVMSVTPKLVHIR